MHLRLLYRQYLIEVHIHTFQLKIRSAIVADSSSAKTAAKDEGGYIRSRSIQAMLARDRLPARDK